MAVEDALVGDPEAVARQAAAAGRIALDTEFVSERRYRALLCLVQVAVPDPSADGGVRIELFDPLAGFEPSPLADVLADPAIEVVLHAGRQDVGLLRREWRTEVRGIFDTQVAAAFAGQGAQVGYANLVGALLKVRVAGSEALTRWERRPLTADQLAYARADVEHLNALADRLQERLAADGRLEWAREECRALEEATDERDPEAVFWRLPRLGGLSGRQRAVARELVRWREEQAEAIDRPPGSLLPDRVVVDLARRAPADRRALGQVRGVPEATVHRHHAGLLEAVRRGQGAEPVAFELDAPDRDPADAALTALGQAIVRFRSLEAGLATEIVATQADLGRLVASVRRGEPEPDVRTLEGWRRDLVGAELLEVLRGRRTVSVGDGGRLRIAPVEG